MGTETQDNWNTFFNNKKPKQNSMKRYIGIITVIIILALIMTNKEELLSKDRNDAFYHFKSSYDGIEMKDMVNLTYDIMGENIERINVLVERFNSGIYNLDAKSLEDWKEQIKKGIEDVNKIHYYESFDTYINTIKEILVNTKYFITYLASNENVDYREAIESIELIGRLSERAKKELFLAFDKNNVPYSIDDNEKIVFSYKIK